MKYFFGKNLNKLFCLFCSKLKTQKLKKIFDTYSLSPPCKRKTQYYICVCAFFLSIFYQIEARKRLYFFLSLRFFKAYRIFLCLAYI